MLIAQAIGNLGGDPEEKTTQGGTRLCRFSLASNKKIKGEKVTTWVNVTVFDEHKIKFIMDYCRKGTKLFVEGEPQARAWTPKGGGDPQASLDLVLGFGSKVEICSSEPSNDSAAGSGRGGASSSGSQNNGSASDWGDDLDDDIPY